MPQHVPQYSISDILPWMECHYRGYYRMINQQWLPPSTNMRAGTAIHKYAEQLVKTGSPDHNFLNTLVPEMQGIVAPLIDAADKHLLPRPGTVLGTEMAVGFNLNTYGTPVELVGRLDLVEEDQGIWSTQYKSIGKGQDIGRLLTRVHFSPHEVFYRTALRRLYPNQRVRGTRLVIFRTYLTKKQKEEGVPVLETFDLDTAPADDEHVFTQLAANIRLFYRQLQGLEAVARNHTACVTHFGVCPLLDHCRSRRNTAPLGLTALESRYPDLPPLVVGSSGRPGLVRIGVPPSEPDQAPTSSA